MSNNKSLFEIGDELKLIIAELEENGGELTEEIEERLAINKNELDTKLDSYRYVISKTSSSIDFLNDQIELLQAKIKAKNNLIDRLKERIAMAVTTYGDTSKTGTKFIATDVFNYTFIKTKPLIVLDQDAPELQPFFKYSLSMKADKATIDKVTELIKTNEVTDPFVVLPALDKKALKEAVANQVNVPIVDEEFNPVLDEQGNIILRPQYEGVAEIDDKSGYVRMT